MKSITASSTFDLPTMKRARYWHWMRRPWQVYFMPAVGLSAVIGGLYQLLSSSHFRATSIFFIVMGVYYIFRYWIIGIRFSRLMQANPQFGKTLTYTLTSSEIKGLSEVSDFRLDWSGIYETYTTPDGFLLYPQKEMYYWIPRSGFSSPDDIALLESWLCDFTKNQVLG